MNKKIPLGLKTCVTICTATMIFILTIEMGARIDDAMKFGAPLWTKYSADRLRTYDDDGVQVNVPGARFEKWQHNKLGFRGPDIEPARKPGTLQVVCLGASESYGLYEGPGKEWPAQLRGLLPSSMYQVTNASVAGLVLQSFRPYVEKYVLPLKPDIIVCFVNPSLYALAWGKNHSLKPLPQKTSRLPLQQVAMTRAEPVAKSQITAATIKNIIISNSRALPKVKQVVKGAVDAAFPHLLQRYQVWNLQKQVRQAEAVRLKLGGPQDTAPAALVASFKADLDDLVCFIQSHGINVMLTTYPTLADSSNLAVYPQFALDSRRSMIEYSNKGLLDIQRRLNAAIASIAAERRAMFVDSESVVPKSTEYFGDVCHYTDNGARLIAQTVASCLTNGSNMERQLAVADRNNYNHVHFQQVRWRSK